jgi:hypothetical protein
VTGVSFFYISEEARGFPFKLATQVTDVGDFDFKLNTWGLVFDIVFWWLILSVLWLVLKNYVFDI